jgi:alpha-beta hydrolase superfamily lysophospholipase
MNAPPLFFTQKNDFLRLLPDSPNQQDRLTDEPLNTLLNNYLSFYQLDHYHHTLASDYAIWRSQVSRLRHNNNPDQNNQPINHQKNSCHIVQQYWQVKNPKGTIVVVHGYLDHTGLYGRLIHCALTQHYNILCFDLPGHGLSDGETAAIDSFDAYSDIFAQVIDSALSQERISYPIIAIGQSTGCSIIVNALLRTPSNAPVLPVFKQIILLAPLIRSYRWTSLRYLYFLLKPFIKRIKRSFVSSSHDAAFNHFVSHDDPLQSKYIALTWLGAMEEWFQKFKQVSTHQQHTQAVTIIQGTGDTTVDWRYNLPLLQRYFSHSHVHYISDARHHLVKESEDYWASVEAIISQQL